ncbi:MAG: response regulator [Oscillospiraceae bacterium]|jgi:YesN/AraC family two-component response regulator|nr:response regulator [Oscillospiraceae bacterium]
MIKVLLVEDEPPIGRAVKKMVEQASPQFSVIGCELNGQAALNRLAKERVDVLITDIQMPVMDGLQLLERVRTLYPDCLTIILSGYQDFFYAQSALRLGAIDYLLKPVSREKLSELLGRLEGMCAMREISKKRDLLSRSIQGGEAPSDTSEEKCLVLLACVGAWPMVPNDTMVPGAVFWESFLLEALIGMMLHETEHVLIFEGKVRAERVIVLENVPSDRVQRLADGIFTRLTKLAAPLAVTLCGFSSLVAMGEVGAIIRALRARMYNEIKLCRSQCLWDAAVAEKAKITVADLPIEDIVNALVNQNSRLLRNFVASAVERAVEGRLSQMEFVRFLDVIICDQRIYHTMKAGVKLDMSEAITNAMTPKDLTENLYAILDHFHGVECKVVQKELIVNIERYLQQNYNKNITNAMLSQEFGFVPSYVSKVFRRHKGVSPAEYMTRLRIEKAKRMIVGQSDLRMKDIAQFLGYSDPYYFSKIFKKETGQWPSQYQEGGVSISPFPFENGASWGEH